MLEIFRDLIVDPQTEYKILKTKFQCFEIRIFHFKNAVKIWQNKKYTDRLELNRMTD
jgi:hypothetical protein